MKLLNLSEIIDSLPLIFLLLLTIAITASRDKHYYYRIHIHQRLRRFFFNIVKDDSVPLLTFITATQFYITVPILIVIRLKGISLNLSVLLIKFLFVPWFYMISLIALLEILAYFKKQKKYKQKKVEKHMFRVEKHTKSRNRKKR